MRKQKLSTLLSLCCVCIIISGAIGFYLGLQQQMTMTPERVRETNWDALDKQVARAVLPPILDAAGISHGDTAIPSYKEHSRRYVISKWQRTATGSTVALISKDKDGDAVVALGMQRGSLRVPQGFMEVPLPKDDLTGFKAHGASRLNGSTGDMVMADKSIEENAVREVYEETGLKIKKDQLNLLSITNEMDHSPTCLAINFLVKLDKAVPIKTIDDEFIDDDLQKPKWVKIKDIKFNNDKSAINTKTGEKVDVNTAKVINEALVFLKK